MNFYTKYLLKISITYLIVSVLFCLPEICFAKDSFENDDRFDQAKVIVLNKPEMQYHNFHKAGDEDWVKFYGLAGQTYTISAKNLEANCDIVIELYDTDGKTKLEEQDTTIGDSNSDENLPWPCPRDGIYYVKLRHYEAASYGENTGYYASVVLPFANKPVPINGTIIDAAGNPLSNATGQNQTNSTGLSTDTGGLEMYALLEQINSIDFSLEDYNTVTITDIDVQSDPISLGNIVLPRTGDVTGDARLELDDAITILKLLAGLPVTIDIEATINQTQAGMENVLFVLQKISGLKK